MASTASSSAGPTASTVTDPAGTWVCPASCTKVDGTPAAVAMACRARRCSASSPFTQILRCPLESHACRTAWCASSMPSKALTHAWPAWAATLPLPIFRPWLTTSTSFVAPVGRGPDGGGAVNRCNQRRSPTWRGSGRRPSRFRRRTVDDAHAHAGAWVLKAEVEWICAAIP